MPQISYISIKDIKEARRYDAEYFKPEYLEIENKLNTLKHFYLLKKEVVSGPFGSTLTSEEYLKEGVYLIRVQDIKGRFFLETENMICISEESNNKIKNSELGIGDLVVSKVGNTIGLIARIDETMKRANVSENNIGIKLKKYDEEMKYFILAFLNSKYGQNQILRRISGNAQPKLNVYNFTELKIPKFSQSFQLQIEEIVKSAHQKQALSKQLYKEAEHLLLTELGLVNYEVKHKLWFTTTKKQIEEAHRYDSEYFQPKYAEIIERIESYEGGWDLVKNTINFKDKNYTPKEEQKYKYLALSNISSQGYIQDYQEEFGKDLPSRARRKINTNDLIISSIEGSLSSCALVEKEFDNAICSTGFFVLNSEKINSETLLILFKSLVIQELLQRGSKGTILTAISKTELEYIKIPLIKPSIQKQIAEKIQESHKLRKESKELLEEAKRKVEEEIEKAP